MKVLKHKRIAPTAAITKYTDLMAAAEDFQIQLIAERADKAARDDYPMEGLTQHDAAVLVRWCREELAERAAKRIVG